MMKLTRYGLMAAMLLFAASVSKAQDVQKDDDRGYIVKVGDEAPDDFSLALNDGTVTSLKKLHGKIVVLQFTASWCSVCRQEMPHLESDVWKAYQNKNLVLIGVDRNEPLAVVQKYHDDMHISYPLALDPGADIFGRFAKKRSGVTRNIVLDPTGKIVYLTRLYNKNEFDQMLKKINELTGNSNTNLN